MFNKNPKMRDAPVDAPSDKEEYDRKAPEAAMMIGDRKLALNWGAHCRRRYLLFELMLGNS